MKMLSKFTIVPKSIYDLCQIGLHIILLTVHKSNEAESGLAHQVPQMKTLKAIGLTN